jgi:NAD+ diphosphatase
MAREPLTFSGAALDRAPEKRRDPAWVEELRERPDAEALVVSERGLWIDGGRLQLVRPDADAIFLGLDGERPLFATGAEPDGGHPAGLREAASELPAEQAALGAYAASLLCWHRRHRFCANCGAPTDIEEAGYSRHCRRCGANHFPRTDPVVIMTVEHDRRLLLGRRAGWPAGRCSVLAGFVSPGESAEEAVVREIQEESGILARDPVYVSSQPWPFPSSLMLGFDAVADDGGEPKARDGELAEVNWFSFDEVSAAAAERNPDLKLPPPVSIARFLIDRWIARVRHES